MPGRNFSASSALRLPFIWIDPRPGAPGWIPCSRADPRFDDRSDAICSLIVVLTVWVFISSFIINSVVVGANRPRLSGTRSLVPVGARYFCFAFASCCPSARLPLLAAVDPVSASCPFGAWCRCFSWLLPGARLPRLAVVCKVPIWCLVLLLCLCQLLPQCPVAVVGRRCFGARLVPAACCRRCLCRLPLGCPVAAVGRRFGARLVPAGALAFAFTHCCRDWPPLIHCPSCAHRCPVPWCPVVPRCRGCRCWQPLMLRPFALVPDVWWCQLVFQRRGCRSLSPLIRCAFGMRAVGARLCMCFCFCFCFCILFRGLRPCIFSSWPMPRAMSGRMPGLVLKAICDCVRSSGDSALSIFCD